MDDPDVIAYLFAADGVKENVARRIIHAEENEEHFLPARLHPIPPAVLLDASEEDVINFLNKSHFGSRRFDISSITDFDTLAADKRDAIATKLT